MASQFKSTSTFSIKPGDFEKHIKALQALDPENLSNVFRNALKAAGTPIAAEMRKLAPVGATGSLKKSIIGEGPQDGQHSQRHRQGACQGQDWTIS